MTATANLMALLKKPADVGDERTCLVLLYAIARLPLAALIRVTGGHILLTFVLVGIGGVVVLCGEAAGLEVLEMAVPDLAVWFTTSELAVYLNPAAAIVAAFSLMQLKDARDRFTTSISTLFSLPIAISLTVRNIWRQRPTVATNDDEDGCRFALAN